MNVQRGAAALTALLLGCTDPSAQELTGGGRCSVQQECGIGLACDSANEICVDAYENENGVFDDRLVVGMSAAVTGPNENLGVGMRQGIEAYFHHVNTHLGGVAGRKLELVVMDDGYDPTRARQNVETMLEGKSRQVFALLGNVGTPTAEVTKPIASQNETPFFGAFTGAGLLRSPPDRYVFNYRASYSQETKAIVDYLVDVRLSGTVPPQNIAVFAQGDDERVIDSFGQSGFDGVLDALRSRGIVQAQIETALYERNTSNVTHAVSQLLNWLAADRVVSEDGVVRAAIVMVPTAGPASQFIQQMNDELSAVKAGRGTAYIQDPDLWPRLENLELTLTSISFVGSNQLAANLRALGGQYCAGTIITQVVPFYRSGLTGVREYEKQLASSDPSAEPGFVSLEGFLAARLFVEGLRKLGRDITTEAFVDTLESLDHVDLGIGVPLGFSSLNHQASDTIWGTMLTDDCEFTSFDLSNGRIEP